MIIKPGVCLLGVNERVMFGMRVVETVWDQRFPRIYFMITAGTDGVHIRKSKHYCGDALDHRTRILLEFMTADLARTRLKEFEAEVRVALGGARSEFDYLLRWDPWHGHLEFDPKRPS